MSFCRVIAPFMQNLQISWGLMSAVQPISTRRIFAKNSQENIRKIFLITDLMVNWDWLDECFSKIILKREIKDAEGDFIEVEIPKYLRDDDILYITFD